MLQTDTELSDLLSHVQKIAVVGLSDKPDRPSYRVAAYLLEQGYTLYPVNPAITSVLGIKAYPSLQSLPESVDLVDVFRKSEDVPAVVDAALAIKAPAIWLQEGVVHAEAAARAEAAGMKVVMDRCIKIDHRRLMQRPS